MGCSRHLLALAFLAVAQASRPARALASYTVGTLPLAAGQGDLEFPLAGDFRGQAGFLLLSQGAFDDRNPFAHLSLVSPSAWLHYDGIRNLRLSASFQESWSLAIASLGVPSSHEERFVLRGRLQQPRGATALYQMLQFDVRSFDDSGGTHRIVFRPRLRIGVGFNLDAERIHSTTLYQEAAFRFADSSYTTRAFDFYRAVVGYTWTTRRGTFVTLALLGEVALDPSGTRLSFLWGPLLSLAYRIAPAAKIAEAPPEPPEIEPR
jgi:hypothetical protein